VKLVVVLRGVVQEAIIEHQHRSQPQRRLNVVLQNRNSSVVSHRKENSKKRTLPDSDGDPTRTPNQNGTLTREEEPEQEAPNEDVRRSEVPERPVGRVAPSPRIGHVSFPRDFLAIRWFGVVLAGLLELDFRNEIILKYSEMELPRVSG
jgi:hypothetical protein